MGKSKRVDKRFRAFGLEEAAVSVRKARSIVVDGRILRKNETSQIASWLVSHAEKLRRQAEVEKIRLQEAKLAEEVVEGAEEEEKTEDPEDSTEESEVSGELAGAITPRTDMSKL